MKFNKKLLAEKLAMEIKSINRHDAGFRDAFQEAFTEGFWAFFNDKKEKDNPYELNGHERDTTFSDECNYQWYSGWNKAYDVEEEIKKENT